MSSREDATAANLAMINAALRDNPIILAAQKAGTLLESVAKGIGLNVSNSAQNTAVQTSFGSAGLGAAAIKAAQELSDKFGIPTFDVSGSIATLPTSGIIDPKIDVGTGKFTQSVFNKSIATLAAQNNPIESFGETLTETVLKPIAKAFDDLFTNRNINDLPEMQKKRVQDIDAMLAILRPQIKAIPTCAQVVSFYTRFNAMDIPHYNEDCSNRDAAIKNNALIQPQIDILTKEREEIFRVFLIEKDFEKQVLEQAEIINRLVKLNPLNATIKAEIDAEIKIASKLIETIITKHIAVTNASLTTLNKAMVAGAARMAEQATANATVTNTLGDSLVQSVLGFGGLFDDLGRVFSKSFDEFGKSLDRIFNPSIDDLVKREAKMNDYRITQYAKFIEQSQAFMERGKKV